MLASRKADALHVFGLCGAPRALPGDGSISRAPRTQRLRITLDLKYPTIIAEANALVRRCFPANCTDVVDRPGAGRCVDVSVYSRHLSCLFPQHGPGRKHERRIELEPWQLEHVHQAPYSLLRGLIRSDGCCFVNRTDVHRSQPYEYVSYHFANMSHDIIDLFLAACRRVGIDDCRVNRSSRGLWNVRVNRRASVALLLENVGTKG
jgi:hypothetical protein